MEKKMLDISTDKSDHDNISDLNVYGDENTFRLLYKASSASQGWMKSTKVCNVSDGCIVQVTTQQMNPDGSYAVAEALTYVPGMNIDTSSEPRRLVSIADKALVDRYLSQNKDDINKLINDNDNFYHMQAFGGGGGTNWNQCATEYKSED